MTSSFSWTDTFHIALNSCLPCLHRTPSTDSLNNSHPTHRTPPDDLRVLLIDSESDSAIDAEAVSLHSNLGFGRRSKKKKNSAQRRITLFGYNLFGRSAQPPIHLPDNDNALYHDAPPLTTPTLTTQSTVTFDSDAAPLDAAIIDNLSGSAAAALAAEVEEEERRQREERRRKHKERKELKKMAQALAVSGDSEFEGFQGSGDGYPRIPSPYLREHAQAQSQPQRPPSPTSLLPHLAIREEEDDEGADLDGLVYTRRRAPGSGSNGGSDSRSRTSTSVSDRPIVPGPQHSYPHHHASKEKTKLKTPSATSTRKKKLQSGSSNNSSSNRKTKSSRSSNTNTDTASLASPVSPAFFPERRDSAITSVSDVLSPRTIEQGQGFFDLEDGPQVRVPAAYFTKSPNETETPSGRGAFPSTGLGAGFGFTGRAKGAFLANTSSTSGW